MKKLIGYLKPYRWFAVISPIMMAFEVTADLLFALSHVVYHKLRDIGHSA